MQQLVKYNLKTTQKTVLTNNMRFIEEPAWSSQGWIAFAHYPSYQIYLLKDDGSGLTQFTEDATNLFPRWSSYGNYLHWGHAAVLAQNTKWLRKSSSNHSMDTVSYGSGDANSLQVSNTKISRINKILTAKLFNNVWYWAHTHLDESPFNFIPIIDVSKLPNEERFPCRSYESQKIYISHYFLGEIYCINV